MPSPRPRALAARLLTTLTACALALTVAPASAEALPSAAPASPGHSASPVTTPGPAPVPGPDGGWQVVDLGAGRYDVSWTAQRDLPVRSDRPTITGPGLRFGPSTTTGDRTVRAVVTATEAPDPADLDVVLSGDRLDEPGSDPLSAAPATPLGTPATTPLATDPGLAGPFTTVSSDYELPGVKLPGMRQKIEMVAHVVEPAVDQATGPRPLVVFLHGRHRVCFDPADDDASEDSWPCAGSFEEVPSHLGYVYAQELLASQGYATVSIRVNGINAQDYLLDDSGADARARIVAEHLDHWTTLAASHQVDLSRVVLVGHSRGGEGVDRASIEIPLSAPYRVVGQVLIAPTDFASHTASYVPTVTLLPYCDGDVSDIQGQKFTDTGRDLVSDDTSLKSSVLVMGANHNFFNTEWTPATAVAPSFDDWGGDADAPCGRRNPDRLRPVEQQAVGATYVAAAVQVFTGDEAALPLLDGSHASVGSIGDADVRSHAIGGGRDLRRPGIEATPTVPNDLADTRLCSGVASTEGDNFGLCGRLLRTETAPHWTRPGEGAPSRQFFEMSWRRAGAVGGLRFGAPLDLGVDRLELRTIIDGRRGPVDVRVRLTDGEGATVTLDPEGGRVVEPLLRAPYLTKLWAQSLLVDASDVTGIDLADVRSVEILGASPRGHLWIADLAAAPAALAAVPDARLPQVNLGDLEITEGDPTGGPDSREVRRVARLPFTINGTVTEPARFVVVTAGQARGARERFSIDVAPGQTRGSIPIEYTADRLADYDTQTIVSAWPTRGLATDDYVGELVVRDDDPKPTLTITTPRSVREGAPVVVQVRLSRPADYDLYASLRVVRGPGRDLRANDVPASFLEPFVEDEIVATTPLWELYVFLGAEIRAGRTSARLVIPTLADGRRERPEALTVSIDADSQVARRTIRVLDAR